MTTTIASFTGAYRFLSNFYPSVVKIDGVPVTCPTVEHAYQASKTSDSQERMRIIFAATPSAAKRAGRKVRLRDDWELVRVHVMRDLLTQKFAHDSLAALLLSTGNAELVEGNTWGDTFWGVCGGTGLNVLGKLLMEHRLRLKQEVS